jgi:hypothetical protein
MYRQPLAVLPGQAATAFVATFEGLKPSLLNFVTVAIARNASTA